MESSRESRGGTYVPLQRLPVSVPSPRDFAGAVVHVGVGYSPSPAKSGLLRQRLAR